jgi:transcriptional antiterminator RfaH
MPYWCCVQVETRRERVASHFLELAGYQTYCPYVREARRNHGRRVMRVEPLFPSYLFVAIVSGFWSARWSPHIIRVIMGSDERPAVVSDHIIDQIRKREGRDGFVVLPKPRGFVPGMRMKVLQGPLQGQIGLLAALRPHERVVMLLQLLGGQQRVELARNVIEAV